MELDLMYMYPKTIRTSSDRVVDPIEQEVNRSIARKFGREFFDGDRKTGYGGYNYNPKYWRDTTKVFVEHYQLDMCSRVLDIGCGKGYMIYDLVSQYPDIECVGIDISEYAIENGKPEVKDLLEVGTADNIHYPDNYFDLVISINTIHNLPIDRCAIAIQEIERVSKGGSFITVDAWTNEEEEARMRAWNLTALTMMSTKEWAQFFSDNGYTGDYYWFIP
jgi:ubiquinone/menaquinone biosynthesis C-methylase UbiE